MIFLVALILLIGWGCQKDWVAYCFWVPLCLSLVGLVLLFVGRVPVAVAGEWILLVPLYAFGLFASEAVLLVIPYYPWTPPAFALLLAPLVWAGVTGLGRGWWKRAVGAWLVLFGQYFALIYNASHSSSHMGCYSGCCPGWLYGGRAPPIIAFTDVIVDILGF